jgi:hypothetical protein
MAKPIPEHLKCPAGCECLLTELDERVYPALFRFLRNTFGDGARGFACSRCRAFIGYAPPN